ncbi:hypothetical protein JQR84_24410 (plasmid) [Pseudomonas luteola]|uniref:hypothetical protein n=1 Tax=Pseudomonas TaxID=286 RepID=UPI003DA04767
MKRIAYVGLSSPIFYDYANQASRCASDNRSSPNPILDGPVGLMLLYDEVWFLCESLCPQNMRHLNYVKFLDRTNLLKGFEFDGSTSDDFFSEEQVGAQRLHFNTYNKVLFEKGVHWHRATDNHSHSLSVKGLDIEHISGNSMDHRNVAFDLCMTNHLGRNVELITNLFTESLFQPSTSFVRQDLAQNILIRNIPNYLTPSGPYSPCIDELRAHDLLSYFRKWISDKYDSFDGQESKEIVEAVERTIEEEKNRLFYKYHDRKNEYISVGKTTLGFFSDYLLPGGSAILDLFNQRAESRAKESKRWQGFVSNANNVFRERA